MGVTVPCYRARVPLDSRDSARAYIEEITDDDIFERGNPGMKISTIVFKSGLSCMEIKAGLRRKSKGAELYNYNGVDFQLLKRGERGL